jgi:hypothetical protein
MKRTIIVLAALLLTLSAGAQELVNEIKTVRAPFECSLIPDALVARGGKAVVSFGMEIPGNLLGYNKCIVAAPVLVNGDSCQVLKPVLIDRHHYAVVWKDKRDLNGRLYPEYVAEIPYKNQPVYYHYQQTIDVKPWMHGASIVLVARKYSTKWNKDVLASEFFSNPDSRMCGCAFVGRNVIYNNGIIDYTGFMRDDQPIYYKNRVEERSYEDRFANEAAFKVDKYTIDEQNFVTGGYDRLKAFCSKLRRNGLDRIKSISVEAAASPEGGLKHNAFLAENRAKNVRDYIAKDLNMDPESIKYTWVDENWEEFEKVVPTFANSKKIQEIIDKTPDLDARERKFKTLKNWGEIKEAFADLRTCGATVRYDAYEGEDSDNPYTATRVYTSNRKVNLDGCMETYSEEENGDNANNVMVGLMEQGRMEEATKYAEAIYDGDIDPYIANNKAVLYTCLGDLPYAESLFKKAAAAGVPGAKNNYGLLLLKENKYKEAAEFYGDCSSYNSIVASLYSGDADAAIAKYRKIENPTAADNYLGAVAYAAGNYKALSLKALAKACADDVNYKKEAMNQAEFIKYKKDSRFIAIVK